MLGFLLVNFIEFWYWLIFVVREFIVFVIKVRDLFFEVFIIIFIFVKVYFKVNEVKYNIFLILFFWI